MKHIILSSLALLMAASLPFMAKAQYFEVNGITYNVLSPTNHTVEVSPSISCAYYRGSINIPSTVTYNGETYDVVALGEEAFSRASISGIIIPSSVTQIKRGCFLFATGPSSITIPASVAVIEPMAFATNNLNAINVDENNPNFMSMDKMLFSKDTTTLVECLKTKSGAVTLPQRTRHLAANAFAYCQNITGVTLPEGLESIGYWAFVDNQRLNNIVIPSSVTHIAPGPFVNCPALNNLSIAEGNTHYYMDGMMIYSAGGDSLVSAHKSADSVFLPSTLRYLNGFGGNSNVKYVHVPDGMTTIGNEAFNGSSLRSIDLPGQMHSIGEWAFYDCRSLTRVGMPATLDTMGEGCFHSCSHLTSVDIPDGLRTVPEGAFFMCNSLSDITWGNAVEVIDTCAFGDCSFTELTLPPTLRVVKTTAFIGDYRGRLKRLIFSAPIDTIEVDAFYSQPLQMLRLKNTVPPATTNDGYGTYGCLDGMDVDSIVVPCGHIDAYLADSYWGQFADKIVEDCNLGVDEVEVARLVAYPNPTTGKVTLQGLTEAPLTIEIYDMAGHVAATFRNTSTLNIASFSPAPYIVKIHLPNGTTHHLKLIKR